jgi:fructokinase
MFPAERARAHRRRSWPRSTAGAPLRVGACVEQLSAPPVDVVDTICAGDAFIAGLLATAVRTHALEKLRAGQLDMRQAQALAHGALEAARITVGRAGANYRGSTSSVVRLAIG